jgi:hypothetical protein
MPDRHILEGVVVVYETTHELQRKKIDGVVLKYILRKYEKVKWPSITENNANERA